MTRPAGMFARAVLDETASASEEQFAWCASLGVCLDDGRTIETGFEFASVGGSGISARHGFWDFPSQEVFEVLDAIYRTRADDIAAVLEDWRTEPIWDDGSSAAARSLVDTLKREGIAVSAAELLALPFTHEIAASLSEQLWHGDHEALYQLTPIPRDDPRLNRGQAQITIPIYPEQRPAVG